MPQTDELLRLNGQSLIIEGYVDDVELIRDDVLGSAEADGYEVHPLLFGRKAESVTQYQRVLALAEARLLANPGLAPWTGDWKFFYDTGAARGSALKADQRDELARVMRLTPLTGIAIGLEAFAIRNAFRGIRRLTNVGGSDKEPFWVSSTVGDD